MKRSPRSAKSMVSAYADMRESPLYQEAEALCREALRPGCGYPIGATELSASPDGKRIAFTGTMLEKLEGVPATRICAADVQTGELRVLSFGPGNDLTAKFSPDGKVLAFRSDRAQPGNFQLYFIDLRRGETRAAPVAPGWVESLEYSPDGTRILLSVAAHGADVAGAQGAKTSKKTDAAQAPAWLPSVETGDDAFKQRSAYILDLKSSTLRRVSPPALNVWEACFSGNDAIAAVVSRGASEGDWYRAHLVSIALASSSKVTVLYRPKDQLGWLSGSPDGRHVAFVEAGCSDRGVVAGDLRIVDRKTGTLRKLKTRAIDVTFTAWRDPKRLVIAGVRDFESVVADVDAATGKLKERFCSAELSCRDGLYPRAAIVRGSDQLAIAAMGFLRPTELLHIQGSTTKTILGFADEGAQAAVRTLRAVKPYRWKAADGQEIHGWLMRGPGDKPAPLVMEVHGGPVAQTAPMFLGRSMYHRMLVARGYALFWPNVRGSSGRGQRYAHQVFGDMGGADAQDCLSGLDQLVADGIADPKRLGVMGGSYGGFMTSWLITQDQRFAAAVSVAPVTNWVSQHLTSNISSWDAEYLGGHYTDGSSQYYTRSPVMYASKVKTPTLNVCGALDRCTPPGQAQEFHNALLQHDVRSVLVTYPLEGHGVRSYPGAIDYAARVVDWFERHMPVRKRNP